MMKDFVTQNKVFFLHLSFWILYASYRFYDIQEYLGYTKAFTYLSVPLFFNVSACYLHYFFILPNLFTDKKPVPYFLKLIGLLTVILTLRILVENQVFANLIANEQYYKTIKL